MVYDVLGWLNDARPFVGAALCLLGATLALIGTVGVLRFPDFYTRLHATSVTDTSSAGALLIGMALMAPGWIVVTKLAAIGLFIFLTTPTATHAIANAAHVAGLAPITGRRAARGGADSDSEEDV